MNKLLFYERYMPIVIKTDRNGHNSKFHEYGVNQTLVPVLKMFHT